MAKIAIISSKLDLASLNIRGNLISSHDFRKTNEKFENNDIFELKINENILDIYLIDEKLIHAENIDKKIDAELFIFISKHVSKENTPAFTVHPIGNWGKADYGGKDNTLCMSSALLLKGMFLELLKSGKERSDFQITIEATHHGPFLEKPVLFIEIGSTEKEWNDTINGKIVADAIFNALKNEDYDKDNKTAIGIGGTHYCNNFIKIIQRNGIAFSHICPKHALENLSKGLLEEALRKTKEKVDFVVLDWKGLGAEKQRILGLLKSLDIEIKRTDRINS